ncbi:hypothetical protein [Mangrovicella endophytica]|uniref:hypothetical protein n=1 Tax=Mangrovicella endophytica TaxID=2066697 RepID=UPI000C9E87CC|nr:hypothetical protein [Mangrovicella endophytica]
MAKKGKSARRKHGGFAFTEYRYGTAKPVSLAGSKPALNAAERDRVVQTAADLLRDWRDSRWEGEASVRHGLRVGLIYSGHGWYRADDAAADVVRRAFIQLGRGRETRPTEEEGQRYFVEPRENCRWCYGPIDEDDLSGSRNRLFCCDEHARLAYIEWDFRNALAGDAMQREAYRAVYRHRHVSRSCENCKKSFKPSHEKSEARFCSMRCSAASQRVEIPERACEQCSTMFRPSLGRSDARFCSKQCQGAAARIHQPRPCQCCGTTFTPRQASNFFCSKVCSNSTRDERQAECRYCGSLFMTTSAHAEYCDAACFRSAYRVQTGRLKRIAAPAFDYLMRCEGARITTEWREAA